jgi:hypothetical protein
MTEDSSEAQLLIPSSFPLLPSVQILFVRFRPVRNKPHAISGTGH